MSKFSFKKKEIGSSFELPSFSRAARTKIKNTENLVFLRSARECLKYIAIEAKSKNINTVLLPVYSCNSIDQPFFEEGFKIKYYLLKEDFCVDINHFKTVMSSDCIVVAIDFFGLKTYKGILNLISNYSNVISVLDCTQSLFEITNYFSGFDYYVGSIRKWIAIPDGAFIKKEHPLSQINLCHDADEFAKKYYKIMTLKTNYLSNGNMAVKNEYRNLYYDCLEILKRKTIICPMSSISKDIIENKTNFDDVIYFRKRNYEYLYNKFAKRFNNLRVLRTNASAPFCLTIFVSNRDHIQRELSKKGIYCQVLWPLSQNKQIISEYWNKISDTILSIPCDQRYNLEDMEYIVKSFEKVLKNEIRE